MSYDVVSNIVTAERDLKLPWKLREELKENFMENCSKMSSYHNNALSHKSAVAKAGWTSVILIGWTAVIFARFSS